LKYRFWYIIWEIVKMFRLITGKKLKPYFPKNLYWDYIIENKIWKFLIKEISDMHSIINPYTERELLNYFLFYTDGIFLDIWTNIGKYSIFVWNKTNMKIFSFEPNIYLVNNYLSYNIKLNWLENRVTLLGIWLWNEKSKLVLNVPNDSFWEASLCPKSQINKTNNSLDVHVDMLDSIAIEKNINPFDVRLIKIDVEWFEYNVFLWAKVFFSKLKKCTLIIEIIEESKNKTATMKLIESFWFELKDKLYWDNYIFLKG
jgi:FkbM family methyltransferase